jgi:hypothetical protein
MALVVGKIPLMLGLALAWPWFGDFLGRIVPWFFIGQLTAVGRHLVTGLALITVGIICKNFNNQTG